MIEIYQQIVKNYNIAKPAIDSSSIESTNLINRGFIYLDPRQHEYLSDDHPRRSYRKLSQKINTLHYGQLKLYMTCLQFLTKYWDPMQATKPKLVYVGAAPCSWALLLARQFPVFELHLYDPEPFDITLMEHDMNDSKREVLSDINQADIYLYKRLFEDEDTKRWADETDVFFVSDIRPFSYEKEGEEGELTVHENMMIQSNWIKKIQPLYSQVKFKLPYSKNLSNPDADHTLYQYLDGRIYFQQWVGEYSTESRLVSSPPYQDTEYDYKIYEEMMFHHNTYARNVNKTRYRNLFDGSRGPYPILSTYGLYNDLDSTMTIKIIMEYLEKVMDASDSKLITEEMVGDFFALVDSDLELANSEQRKIKGFLAKPQKLLDRRGELA